MKLTKRDVQAFSSVPGVIEEYISQIPEEELDIKRNKNTWTIREHIYHIADVQALLLGRMKLIRDTAEPVIEPFFPEKETALSQKFDSIQDALSVYKKFRKKQLKLLKNCSKKILKKTAVHKEYKQYSIPIIVKHMLFHEYWHMYRIEEIWLTHAEYFK